MQTGVESNIVLASPETTPVSRYQFYPSLRNVGGMDSGDTPHIR